MAHHRAIVGGWDSAARRPKGVASAGDVRAAVHALATHEGIMQEADSGTLTKYSTSMKLGWKPFTAVIKSRLGGWYTPRLDAGSVELDPGDFSYPRIDVIWVKQYDYQVDGEHPDSEVVIGVAKGTPTASPSAPPIPTGALALWTVTVPEKATSSSYIKEIVPAAQVCPTGGLLIVDSPERQEQLTAALKAGKVADSSRPVMAYRADLHAFKLFNGSAWIPATYPDQIEIAGKLYPRSGVVTPPSFTFTDTWAPVYVASIVLTMPFTPPSGYTFDVSCHESSGYTFVGRAGTYDGNRVRARVFQIGSTTTSALKTVTWTLVRES